MATITMIRQWTQRSPEGDNLRDWYADYVVDGIRLRWSARHGCGELIIPLDQPVDTTWATYSPALIAAIKALADAGKHGHAAPCRDIQADEAGIATGNSDL